MSIWGPGPFENDDGADWFADIRDEPALDLIRDAVEEIADPAHVGYLEVTDGAEAVAAAEVLAELLGSPGDNPVLDDETEELAEALKKELQRKDKRDIVKLIKHAIDALDVVLNDAENSELRQMWEEDAGEMQAWTAAVVKLQERLHKLTVP
jgi:hypothetical protein